MTQSARDQVAVDPVLATYVAAVRDDPDTFGVLLHGSRASGRQRDDSDYDLICIVTEDAYGVRREQGQLHERVSLDGGSTADLLYQTPIRIAEYVTTLGWYTATYLGARVAFDRNGDIGTMLARMRSEANRVAGENTATAYDGYLNSFVRSMKSARRLPRPTASCRRVSPRPHPDALRAGVDVAAVPRRARSGASPHREGTGVAGRLPVNGPEPPRGRR